MSFIQGLGSSTPINSPNLSSTVKPQSTDSSSSAPAGDRVELSSLDQFLSKLKTNDIRADKVASVKAAINDGSYEDDYKLDIATDRLLDDLNR